MFVVVVVVVVVVVLVVVAVTVIVVIIVALPLHPLVDILNYDGMPMLYRFLIHKRHMCLWNCFS